MDKLDNMSDILISDDDFQRQARTKKLIMMIAVAIIFLSILIGMVAVITSSDDEQKEQEQAIAKNNNLEPMPLQEPEVPVEIENNNKADDKFDALLAEIRNRNNDISNPQSEPAKPQTNKEITPEKPKQIAQNSQPTQPLQPAKPSTPKPPVIAPTQTKDSQKQNVEKKPESKPESKPTQATQQTPAKPSTPPTPAESKPTTPKENTSVADMFDDVPNMDTSKNGQVAEKGFYIQVGSFSNTPNADFRKKIANYSYRVYEGVNSNGVQMTRYLIGPYTSKAQASKDISKFTNLVDNPVHFEVK